MPVNKIQTADPTREIVKVYGDDGDTYRSGKFDKSGLLFYGTKSIPYWIFC